MKKILTLLLVTFTLLSCSDSKDGDWDDNILLSQKQISVDSAQNSILLTTGGNSWWISEIFFMDGQSFDISDIDTTSQDFQISESDFTLDRINGNEIQIVIEANNTNLERVLHVGLQSGNYFDGFKIIQSAE